MVRQKVQISTFFMPAKSRGTSAGWEPLLMCRMEIFCDLSDNSWAGSESRNAVGRRANCRGVCRPLESSHTQRTGLAAIERDRESRPRGVGQHVTGRRVTLRPKFRKSAGDRRSRPDNLDDASTVVKEPSPVHSVRQVHHFRNLTRYTSLSPLKESTRRHRFSESPNSVSANTSPLGTHPCISRRVGPRGTQTAPSSNGGTPRKQRLLTGRLRRHETAYPRSPRNWNVWAQSSTRSVAPQTNNLNTAHSDFSRMNVCYPRRYVVSEPPPLYCASITADSARKKLSPLAASALMASRISPRGGSSDSRRAFARTQSQSSSLIRLP